MVKSKELFDNAVNGIKKTIKPIYTAASIALIGIFTGNDAKSQVVVPGGKIIKFEYNNKFDETVPGSNQLIYIGAGMSADTLPSNITAKTIVKDGMYFRYEDANPLDSEFYGGQSVDFAGQTAMEIIINPFTNGSNNSDTTKYIQTSINSTDGRKFRIKKIWYADAKSTWGQNLSKTVLDNRNNFPYINSISNTLTSRPIDVGATNNSTYNTYKTSWNIKTKFINESGYPGNTALATNYINSYRVEVEYEPCASVAINSTNQTPYKGKANVAQSFTITPGTSAVEIKGTDYPKTIFTPGCPNSSN